METVRDFIFRAPKSLQMVTAATKLRHFLLGKKAMTNLDSIIKTRDITLPTKVCLNKAMVFPVVMYGCESWTIKKAELWRIDAFELWCWRRLLWVPWTARRSNQSFLKEISPEYSLEDWCWSWNSNTLTNWYKEPTHWKRPWCWERLKAGGEGDDRGWDGWMATQMQRTWVWASSRSWWWTGQPGVLKSMGLQRIGHDWATELKKNRGASQVALVGKRTHLPMQEAEYRFDPWVRKIPWGSAWQSIPAFFSGESHGQRSLSGYIVHQVAKIRTPTEATWHTSKNRINEIETSA